MKTIILMAIFATTFSCAMPVREKRLTKSEKMLKCTEGFIYKYEIDPKIALEICEHIYDKKS